MKHLYSTILAAFVITGLYGQSNGLTNYPVSIAGTNASVFNVKNRSAFVIDNTDNKWIGFNYGNVNSYQLLRYNGSQWDTFSVFNAISATNKVNALAVDPNNNLWIGHNFGLTKFNGTSFTTYNTSNSGIASDTIISLACCNGNVYAGSFKGLSVYNGATFTNYNTGNGMNSNIVNCITVENASTIWLGNPNGLDKFNGSNFTFNYVTSTNTADNVNIIYIDAQNNKWIGTNAHGTIKYDNSNFYTMQQLYPSATLQETLGMGAWPTVVKTICKGPNGGVLFCSPMTGNQKITQGRSYEITNTQLLTYVSIAAASTNTATVNNPIMQHDVGSNKIFVVSPNGYYNSVLSSYNLIPFSYNNMTDENQNNTAFLDINNVSALITDNSNQHWDNTSSQTKYFVPKQNNTSPLFASAMWIGGWSNGSNLHTAAMTYRQNGYDFWPGPIDPATGKTDTAIMSAYNKVWKVNRFDIANFIYAWNAGHVQNHSFVPVAAIVNWPGNSPYGGKLAPFVDNNNDGVYNYMDGDYPLIKGDQMIWSVYNDNTYPVHGETGGSAFGIDVQASAYAFTCPNIADSNIVLNNTTFYNYKITNHSNNTYDSTYISLWMDSDLGNYQDDYIVCDVMNDFGYTYNGDNYDEDIGGLNGYHSNLPVFACNILGGPVADANDGIDNNHNCLVDEPGERCMMSGFTYYSNTGDPLTGNPNPNNPQQYYNFMNSKWKNGTAITYGGQGIMPANAPCKYLYPGNSDPLGYGFGYNPLSSSTNCVPAAPIVPPVSNWTEGQAGNLPGDRRFMVNVGKFTMQPGGTYELDYALVFSQDSANCDSNNTCVITRATADNKRVKNWFNTNSYPSCLSLAGVGIKEHTAPPLDLNLYPNPASSSLYIDFATSQKNVTIEVFDMLGNLIQGFQYNELGKYAVLLINTLQSGVYLVKIQSADGFVNRKFIKE